MVFKPWAFKAKIHPNNVLNHKASATAFETWQHYQRDPETLLRESSVRSCYSVALAVRGAMVRSGAQREAGHIFSGAPKPHSNISQSALSQLRTTIEHKPEVKDPWSLKISHKSFSPTSRPRKTNWPHSMQGRGEQRQKTNLLIRAKFNKP